MSETARQPIEQVHTRFNDRGAELVELSLEPHTEKEA